MLGSVLNGVLGYSPQPQPTNSWTTRTNFVPEPGQTAHGYTFDWGPSIGQHCRVSVGYFPTEREAHEALARALVGMQYEAPKWWQFWRWGSVKLPKEVVRLMAEQP